MRIKSQAWGLAALVAASLAMTSGALRASARPVVHVKAVVKDGSVRLEAQANGPFEYTTSRLSESLYVLDLSGVSAGDPAGARVVPSELMKSYRVLTYAAGEKPVVRVEILLSQGVEPQLERKDADNLTLLVSPASSANAPSASPLLRNLPAATLVTAKSVQPSASSNGFEAIENVKLAQKGEQTEVSVLGSGRLTYHAMRLANPDRLVLDFAGSHLRASEKHIASNLDPVREVRLAQFTPDVSRVVIDLREPARYNIDAAGNTVTVSFAAGDAAAGAHGTSSPSAPPSNLMTAESHAPVVLPTEGSPAKPAEIPAPAAVLPAALTETASALASPVATNPRSSQEAAGAKQAASQAAAASGSASGAAASTAETSSAPQTSAMAQPGVSGGSSAPVGMPSQAVAPSRYTGEPISVNLKDVDLADFFRLIHEISGLNIVVDPSVKGSLTIVLDNVPWDQALDIVLHNNDLDKQLDGNVLRIATKETLRKEAQQTVDLATAQAEAVDLVTTTRVLSYAKSDDMVAVLKKFLSKRGDVLSDPRTNTLIISDIPSTMPTVDNLLRQLDRKSQQVEIEARVVSANRTFSREIGTQFGIALGNNARTSVSGGSGVGASPITRNFGPGLPPPPPILFGTSSGATAPTSGSIPLNTNLATGAPTSGISYSYSDPTGNFALDMIITAAENRGVGKLISKPNLFTQNNQKATVKDGVKIPVQTIVNNTVSVQFVEAVLQLDVTPQITADGTIFMDVTVTNDQIDQAIPRVQGIPAIDTQSVESKVTVPDGQTVVIGGVDISQQRTSIDQVPLFGSIPVLGNLFKHTSVSSEDQTLWFFLTPRVLPD